MHGAITNNVRRSKPPSTPAQQAKQATEAEQAVPNGWGVQPPVPAPFIWNWSFSKLWTVLCSCLDLSFLDWGRDLENYYMSAGTTVRQMSTEVGVLSALLITITADFQKDPPEINQNSLIRLVANDTGTDEVFLDLYTSVWTFASLLLLIVVILCVITLVMISMHPEMEDRSGPATFMLTRVGKAVKLPIQLFIITVIDGLIAVCVWCVMAFHWKAFVALLAFGTFMITVVLSFFIFPMVGALLDTLEVQRAGRLDSLLHERLDTTEKSALSPDFKHRNRAVSKLTKKLKSEPSDLTA